MEEAAAHSVVTMMRLVMEDFFRPMKETERSLGAMIRITEDRDIMSLSEIMGDKAALL